MVLRNRKILSLETSICCFTNIVSSILRKILALTLFINVNVEGNGKPLQYFAKNNHGYVQYKFYR